MINYEILRARFQNACMGGWKNNSEFITPGQERSHLSISLFNWHRSLEYFILFDHHSQ